VQLSQVEENARIYFEPDSANSFSLFGSSLAVLNQGSFRLYSPTGTQQLALTRISSVPAMSVSDSFVMLYSRGAPDITVATLTAQQDVISLCNDGGAGSAHVHGHGQHHISGGLIQKGHFLAFGSGFAVVGMDASV